MSRITFTDAAGEEVEVETDLSGMVLTLANDASKAATVADIMADHRHFHVGFDPASGPGTSVIYVVDAGGAYHILPESEAREWEADGHTIRKLPPKKPGEFAPDHAYNLPKLTERQLRAFGADGWGRCTAHMARPRRWPQPPHLRHPLVRRLPAPMRETRRLDRQLFGG